MKTYLDIDKWDRKDHFSFFKGFNEPFFGVTVEADCTIAYAEAKKRKVSFFLYYLHKSLAAANQIEAFKYRIEGEKVAVYETVNASPTVPRSNGTFGFSYMEYQPAFNDFYPAALKEMDRVSSDSKLVPATSNENVIHYSALPWIKFTSLSHARHYDMSDSIPKISFGKMYQKDTIKLMPVSIHVNHALLDGYHVGLYIDLFQNLMNETL
ncbi:chloramphenicol acetyltransferase [Fulvivirga sp. 29W222]|uniref:Chloramphenicol acetyltransferase n=1 Tax=Fulvivirga marina TaxID=2494733 RepID=A0A937FXG4_9BACT|nr:chloramphenicol acetyltransferase [Fulvivirga marina]MBL6446175.1 chloramphenicol acetyltransferase [Fulvivirga marina]